MKNNKQFLFINKQMNRIKRLRKFDNISHKENDLLRLNMVMFIKDIVKKFIKKA